MTAAPNVRPNRPVAGILALTVLLLGSVLLSLGAAHAVCAATMTHEPAAVTSMTMPAEHDTAAALHTSGATTAVTPSMPWMADGLGDCMIGAGLLCLLIAPLIAAVLRTEHTWSSTRTASPCLPPWPRHLRTAASPSLTVLSISRT